MFVPADFTVPERLETPDFRLEPLGPQHNAADYAAWTSSVEHIRSTPGYPDGNWPDPTMGLDGNLADLTRHAADFAARKGFTYTVLSSGDIIGCVYIYPSKQGGAEVQSWVTAARAELDRPLYDAVSAWLAADWPFTRIDYLGR